MERNTVLSSHWMPRRGLLQRCGCSKFGWPIYLAAAALVAVWFAST
jgi:uncharacterized protein (TIGR03382 family)